MLKVSLPSSYKNQKMSDKFDKVDLEKVPKVVYQPKYDPDTPMEHFKQMVEKTYKLKFDAEDNTQYTSYKDLYDEVSVYVKALKDEGMKTGDYVACYMSNRTEAVYAFLAAAAIGAIFCGSLPLLGTKAVLSRFDQIKPKILFTSGNFIFDGKEYKMDERIPEVVAGLTSLQKVVYCPSKLKGNQENISDIPNCVRISDFLHNARENLRNNPKEIKFEQLPFDHPLCVLFTSGTTGAPKGLVHSTGSFITTLKNFGLHQNLTRKDTIFNQSPVGWLSWNLFVNSLHLGLTVVNYDGYVFQETPMRFWDLIDKFGITSSFIWSSTLDFMDTHNWKPTPKHSLKTLRQLFPVGSPAKPSSFDFVTEKVKPGIFCSPVYGCTETLGFIGGFDSNMPVYRGEIQAYSLGFDVHILDKKGISVIGERGEFVLASPYPGLPVKILNDENKKKLKDTYLSDYPDYWNIADDAWLKSNHKRIRNFWKK